MEPTAASAAAPPPAAPEPAPAPAPQPDPTPPRARRLGRPILLALTALSALVAGYLGFVLPGSTSVEALFTDSLYWFMWALLVLFAFALVDDRQAAKAPLRLGRRELAIAAACLALAGMFIIALGNDYRVLADEANLMSTSMSLYDQRKLTNIVEGLSYFDSYHVVAEGVASRPGLFPFCAMLLHNLFGYDIVHGFVVNFFATAGTLAIVFAIGRRLAGAAFGVFAALSLAAIPVFTLSATSAGFDALNLMLVALYSLQVLRYFARPDNAAFELLLMCALLAANTRYESIVLLLPTAIIAVVHGRLLLAGRPSWRLPLVPLLLVPLIWQRGLTHVRNEAVVTGDGPPTFALEHVPGNIAHAIDFYSKEPLFYLAVAGFLFALWMLLRRRRDDLPRVALMGLGTFAIVFTHMAFYLGDVDTAHNRRLAVAHLVVVGLCAAYPLALMWRRPHLRVLAAAIVAIGVTIGLTRASRDEVGRALTTFRDYREELAFLERYPPDTTMLINDRAVLYVPHRFGSISIDRANYEQPRFSGNLKAKLFSNVLLLQRVMFDTGKPEKELDAHYQTEVLYEFQVTATWKRRISRVTGWTPDLPAAPAKKPGGGAR